jgi:hypothetical protein
MGTARSALVGFCGTGERASPAHVVSILVQRSLRQIASRSLATAGPTPQAEL